jgi:hypothetical protein
MEDYRPYYVHFNGAAYFVKESEFFKEQGGLNEPWGQYWKLLHATSIEHARTLAELKTLKKEFIWS